MRQFFDDLENSQRVALGVFAVLTLTILLHDSMVRWISILWLIPLVIVWGIALLLAVFHIFFALREEEGWRRKSRAALAVPAAIILAVSLSVSGVGRVISASAYLFVHRDEMARAQIEAGPGMPAAMRYIEGVPDGGVAIIRSLTHPLALPVKTQIALTGERIRGCRRILFDAFACPYD